MSRTAVRSALRLRAARSRDSVGERAASAYSVGLAIAMYGAPALIASRDGWGAASASDVALVWVALAVCAAFFALGRSRGPLTASLGDVDLLFHGPVPRTRIYPARPVVLAALFGSAGVVVGAVVLTDAAPGEAGFGAALAEGVLSGATLGMGALLAWIAGSAHRAWAGLALPAAVAGLWTLWERAALPWAMLLFPPLWGGAAADSPWPTGTRLAAGAAALLVLAAAAIAALQALTVRVRGERLREQASRWERARTAAATLDLRTAAGALGDPPRFLRRLPLTRLPARLPPVLARDLLGALRRWPGCLVGLLLVIAGAAALAVAGDALWALAAAPVILLGVSRTAGGLRAHAENVGRSHPLDPATPRAAWAHVGVPLAVALTGATAGTLLAVPLGAPVASLADPILVALMAVPLLLPSAHGFVPPAAFAGPLPTPFGDAAAALVIAWWARTYLFGIVATWIATSGDAPSWAVYLAALAVALLWAHRALQKHLCIRS